ncbi:MAG: replicative DNA helicase [Thiomargarita sp.]|nr:replicative DNA helicase [Thiomargarita sp.]
MQKLAYSNTPPEHNNIESIKTAPFSKEAEQSVLGGLMLNNDAWVLVAEILSENDFYLRQHQILFRAIQSLSEEGYPCDPITISEWLQKDEQLETIGGSSYLGLLANNTPSAANVMTYAGIVQERSILRHLIQVGIEITESALNTQGKTTTELLDNAEKQVFQIAELGNRSEHGFSKIDNILTETLNRIDTLSQQDGNITGISTGFIDFDKQTSGLQCSDLIIVAGRPSMGKCLGLGTKVLMYCGELKAVEKIKIGELLMGVDSKPQTVLSIARGRDKMVWIRQKYAIDYQVNESHVLSLKSRQGEVINLSVKDYLNKSAQFKLNYQAYKVAIDFTAQKLPFAPHLLDINDDKLIPIEFLINSQENRLQLLATLIQKSGYYNELQEAYEICFKNKNLVQQIKFLCDTLGFRTIIKENIKFENSIYQIQFFGDFEQIPVKIKPKKTTHQHWQQTDIKIEAIDVGDYYGFELDGDGLFLLEDMTVTHNTAFAMNIAQYVAVEVKKTVAVFSMEMSNEQLAMRLISSLAGVNLQNVRTGQLNDDEWFKITKAVTQLEQAPLFIDETPALSPTELRARTRRLARENGKLGLIVIDYLQLMQVPNNKESRANEVSEISRTLKALAKELNVPVIALSQLNRGLEQRVDKRPKMSDLRESGCLTGGSLVTCADTGESIPIRDLEKINNFHIWALNPRTMLLKRAKVTKVFSNGTKPVFRLTTQSGHTISATNNHKFYTIEGWKRVDELQRGEHIALARHIPNPAKILKQAETEQSLIAHLMSDDCTILSHSIHYITRELDIANIVVELATKIFGDQIKTRIDSERNWFQVYISYSRKEIDKNPMAQWLNKMGLWDLNTNEKQIPRQIFQQKDQGIANFLRHLWANNSCIYFHQEEPIIQYITNNGRLAFDIQSLLVRLNIFVEIKKVLRSSADSFHYQIVLQEEANIIRFIDLVGIVGKYKQQSLMQVHEFFKNQPTNLEYDKKADKLDIIPKTVWQQYINPAMQKQGIDHQYLYKKMGINYSTPISQRSISRKNALLIANIVKSKELKKIAQSDVYWDIIVSIEPLGEKQVFDLTVPSLHNFVCNSFISHNSIEQDADLITFIYRDEVYNEDSPDKGTAEIIIAKQRNGPIGKTMLTFRGEITKFESYTPNNDGYYGE